MVLFLTKKTHTATIIGLQLQMPTEQQMLAVLQDFSTDVTNASNG